MAIRSRAARSRGAGAWVVFVRRYDNVYILRRTVPSIRNHMWAYFWNNFQLRCCDRGVELQRRSEWLLIAAHTPVSARTANSGSVSSTPFTNNLFILQLMDMSNNQNIEACHMRDGPNSLNLYAIQCAPRDDSA